MYKITYYFDNGMYMIDYYQDLHTFFTSKKTSFIFGEHYYKIEKR